MTLTGRLAFITGAGSGIGRSTCQILARDGALIVAADKNKRNADETINAISKEFKQEHISLELDVGNSSSIDEVLGKILAEYGKPPTIIVNSAGITRDNFILKLSEEDFDEVLKINLKGTFLIVQKCANAIIDHGINNASIINVGSISGKYGNIGQANYAASKAGVERLTRTASLELANKGIRLNSVLPGVILTPMTTVIPDKVKAKLMSMIPMRRFGEPEEIAEVIAFLAGDKSSYITGTSIEVTGGF
ncbi:estradiol 17-beta-dehydrogenase 8-like [Anoplophora glabripennis]|uniref:estradiol 17-beta-dehydrogenase 8-like n=1 Tax=Anoplophora glabripennis TaxID=217634 RepID=UPI000C794340|nr:estradiol 17-beta-dehydrogenase 8-like [Anoplophora glabripennis]